MKLMRNSELLSDNEIMDLLKDHQRTSKLSKKEELTGMARVVLRESLEKAVEVSKKNQDFGSAQSFSNLLYNFESFKFFIEFEKNNSIVYSFESITESGYYTLKDSGFFTLLKQEEAL
ncbi:MAG TPA: hypothetical protein DEB37_12825 [Lysinibacillus sp.]|nr:hypothetical protein [Lysinibacillus sp.]